MYTDFKTKYDRTYRPYKWTTKRKVLAIALLLLFTLGATVSDTHALNLGLISY